MRLISTPPSGKAEKPPLNRRTGSNGGQKQFGRKADGDAQHHSDNASLKSQLSAVLRDQLVSELKAVSSADAAAVWARRILPAKNSLNIADARQVENAFQGRLAELELRLNNPEPQPSSLGTMGNPITYLGRKGPETGGIAPIERIEKKGGPARPEPRRIRDPGMEIRRRTSLLNLRPASGRSPPLAICPKPSTRAKGE